MELKDYLQSAQKSLFRFEYLQEFTVPEENAFFRADITSGPQILPLMKGWWDFLDTKKHESVITQRVRFVKHPLCDYVKWELRLHLESMKHGDDIRLLSEDLLTTELKSMGDFWLIDDFSALEMHYDSQGKYTGFREMPVENYLNAKEHLLNNSIPLTPEAIT